MSNKPENVAVYHRTSTAPKCDDLPGTVHILRLKQQVEQTPGWNLAGVYADIGRPGNKPSVPSEFNRLIQDCKDGKVSMILSASPSAITCDLTDGLEYMLALKKLGVPISFTNGGTLPDELTANILQATLDAIGANLSYDEDADEDFDEEADQEMRF